MVLLFDGDTDCFGPVDAAVEAIVSCGCVIVFVLLFKLACYAVVGDANGVESMSGAVSAHVAWLGHLFDDSTAATTVLVGVIVLHVLLASRGKFGNGSAISESFFLSASCMLATMSPLVMDALAIFAM